MQGHSSRARRALAHLPDADPALAALALWCTHRDGDGPTCTRGDTVLYGPDFAALSLPEQVGLAGHHVLHVALRHGRRMGAMAARQGDAFTPDIYNIAADALVNEALLQAGHALPRPALRLTDLLRATLGPQAAGPDALAAWELDRLYLALLRDGAAAARAHADAQGTARDLSPDGTGDAMDSGAPDWQGRLAQALAAGRAAGRGLGLLAGRIGDAPAARTPWERLLRGLLARALTDTPRRSHARPARRWLAMDAHAHSAGGPAPVFEPGALRGGLRARIAVGLDTSGSIPDDVLARFGAELAGIAGRTGAETHLLAFDETVHLQRCLGPGDWSGGLPRLPARRGGGTAFGEMLAQADRLSPALIVVLTDLDGGFGALRPAAPVLWAVTALPAAPPPFGRVLELAG
ncbi:hypothetical protein DKT77_05725 [Meridianimarinicoccus roseus]|uniref:Metal-dependent peptidase n=1 Tax=Meridianimarinicoccus roseus TaxID=2072018 RepID=A0A2V2LMX7_9RHOB|nr:VWA-like domain-containing protein [Meridianimarinicoccus roseus]PWR03639.1 hypothetical protein DKT77_05725 [Meridianimarinicoccus roseus]